VFERAGAGSRNPHFRETEKSILKLIELRNYFLVKKNRGSPLKRKETG
jgi:hypothetical protein